MDRDQISRRFSRQDIYIILPRVHTLHTDVGMPRMRLTTQAGALPGQVITRITPREPVETVRYRPENR